jgi:DNA-binding CsgD family transcriptional regulator
MIRSRTGYTAYLRMLATPSEMARLYAEGLSCEAVGERLGVSHSCVARTLRRSGLSTRGRGEIIAKRNRASAKSSAEELLALHAQGLLPNAIAAQLGMQPQTVRQRLRALGVKLSKSVGLKAAYAEGRRPSPSRANGYYGYTLNEATFEAPLTPATAWLLGVIVGDGCIVRRKGRIYGLDVCGDRDVCEKTCKILGSNANPQHKTGGCHTVRFHSVRLAQSLAQFGIMPDKCYSVPWPKGLPAELTSHFARGFWDADGCVTHKCGGRGLVLSAVSCSKPLMARLHREICSVISTKSKLLESQPLARAPRYAVAFSCLKALKLGQWLWASSAPAIRSDRKYARFLSLLPKGGA